MHLQMRPTVHLLRKGSVAQMAIKGFLASGTFWLFTTAGPHTARTLGSVILSKSEREHVLQLKGQCHEIFDLWFFSPIDYP
jgi:hypothetical protein